MAAEIGRSGDRPAARRRRRRPQPAERPGAVAARRRARSAPRGRRRACSPAPRADQPTIQAELLAARVERGRTALMFGAAMGLRNFVRSLIDAGAKLDEQDDDGATALILAVRGGRIDVMELLHRVGCKPRARRSPRSEPDLARRGARAAEGPEASRRGRREARLRDRPRAPDAADGGCVTGQPRDREVPALRGRGSEEEERRRLDRARAGLACRLRSRCRSCCRRRRTTPTSRAARRRAASSPR